MNILKEATEIVNNRSEEKERQYGPFNESMERAANIASLIANKEITVDDMFICMQALKLSRQAYVHKEDNLLDLVAYIGAWNNYKNKEEQ
jgi:hypothetical protein